MSRLSRWLPILVCALVGGAWLGLRAWRDEGQDATRSEPSSPTQVERESVPHYPASQFYMERDFFLSITDPPVVSAQRATYLRPMDEVFGVVVGGEARAYPITMIAYHHVVNDVIRGIPVAVTY